jgi:hypothetical protein
VQLPIEKVPGARENAQFVFDAAAYAANVEYAAERVVVEELGIVRGQRLCLLEIRPVSHNPAAGTLTFWPEIVADLKFAGGFMPDDALNPLPGLGSIILNPEVLPNVTSRGTGNYLIVVASAYQSAIGTFAAAKAAQGYTVSTWVPTSASNTVIKNYITSLWGTASAPDYVLLVGDTDTIPHWTGGGEGSPATDIQYGCMDGSTDWYPDIAIGRFPVRNASQLQAIVDKTLLWENGPLPDPDYVKRAVFMASNDNYTVSEGTHNWVIQNYMVPNEIVSDKLYCHTYNATTQQVRNAFNNGRFFGIYSGHGAETYWADGPVFYASDVNNLTNVGMYPYVFSFACVTGTYTIDECFMETWVRAMNKGAVVAIGSSVNSYWTEDDVLEKRLFDSIYDEDDSVVPEAGPVLNDAKMRYLAQMGSGSTTRRYFEMYNIMGDPAMPFPGNCSDAGTAMLDSAKYACEDTASIRVGDCGLNTNDNVVETITVPVVSNSEPAGELVVLTETNANSALFEGSIALSATNAAGVLQVSAGDTLTVTYIDADNGQGQQVTVTATALVDCTPPTITNVHAADIQPRSAVITFDCDELASGTVRYGLSCSALNNTATGGLAMSPTISLSGLTDDTTYYYKVEAADEAGNVTQDPTCYSFTTPEVPDFFTQLFSGDNDLDYQSLVFTPNGSTDFYHACNETITALPTDPAGGTTITLTDDSSTQINLTGGASVSLYGVSYTSFFVGSNGYVTFNSGDSAYTESLAAHFNRPRISALFDDLDPAQGGTLSWKQLADRAVVTWLNTPEHNGSNQNTLQIEMYFDGQIKINYLAVAATDGLAGLSRGTGVDPDFLMSDLTALGTCQTFPPTAHDSSVSLPVNTPTPINLIAEDDGLPNPPGVLTFSIVALPAHGSLADPNGGAITSVPYALVSGGHAVIYTPATWYVGADSFQFLANDGGTPPDGGDSNIATMLLNVYGVPEVLYSFPLDTNPGWTTTGAWAFGHPTGAGSHNKDPNNGYTGTNVYGYNLTGDYTNNMPVRYLTTTALNCSAAAGVELRFWRWLGVEQYDHAGIDVSTDGSTWTPVWANNALISESAWSFQTYAVPAADHQATVYFRWSIGPTDVSITYPGWNIDDIEIWGVIPHGGGLVGDMNCDGTVDFRDINPFVLALTNPAAYAVQFPACNIMNGDINGDGAIGFGDINPFVNLLTAP